MDTINFNSLSVGMVLVQKVEREAPSQASFAQYDALTPDEPPHVWKLTKRLLTVLGNVLSARPVQTAQGKLLTDVH